MSHLIQFTVPGDPKPQPRPRAFAINGSVRVYDPHTAEVWKSAIADAARPHCPREPWRGPVDVILSFQFQRPKTHFRSGKHADLLRDDAPDWHTKRPDCDNLAKSVLDALTLLGFWKDDSQVASLDVRKHYGEPGVVITVSNMALHPAMA